MIRHHHFASLAAMAVLLFGCNATAPSAVPSGSSFGGPSVAPSATTKPTFASEAFASISSGPVPAAVATELERVLQDLANRGAGVSATVMSSVGTWSGAAGTADGTRAVTTDTQFSIASTTKAVTAVQVMQLVEAGKLGLDDQVAKHLPADLEFDTNGATIRNLLGHRSGIPDYVDVVGAKFEADPLHFWTPAELLAAIPADRMPPGGESEYANVNYLLLGLVVEQVTGRKMAEVLPAASSTSTASSASSTSPTRSQRIRSRSMAVGRPNGSSPRAATSRPTR